MCAGVGVLGAGIACGSHTHMARGAVIPEALAPPHLEGEVESPAAPRVTQMPGWPSRDSKVEVLPQRLERGRYCSVISVERRATVSGLCLAAW